MDISHEDLIFLIRVQYPNLVHGVDFVVGQPIDDDTGERIGNAFIAAWRANVPMPNETELAAMYEATLSALNDERIGRPARYARKLREKLLRDTDWVVTRAVETGATVPTEITAYRQALRDVPEQEGFPDNITWPEAPQ